MAHRIPLKHRELLCISKRQDLEDGTWLITLRVYASDGWCRKKRTRYPGAITQGWKRMGRWISTQAIKRQEFIDQTLETIRDSARGNGWTIEQPGANRSK